MRGHELFDPWAPHPVVNKHICFGGGGGGEYNTPVPSVPDYSKFIQQMTNMGGYGEGWAKDLYNWAQSTGVNLSSIANTVSAAAGKAADTGQAWHDNLMQQWSDLSSPLYKAQQADAMRMYGDLPGYEESQAGKYGADAAMAVDQSKAAAVRSMEARGLAPNAAATGALDTQAGTQRALATTAAAEQGRYAARTEARTAGSTALSQEATIPNVGATEGALATQNRQQQTTAPTQAATASAGLYNPSLGYYQSAYPYYAAWGSTMGQSFNENLGSFNAGLQQQKLNAESGAYSPLSTIGGLALGVAGSYLGGPIGGAIGSAAGKALTSIGGSSGGGGYTGGPFGSTGGTSIFGGLKQGGAIDAVPPSASPSNGRRADDVHAALSVGEFVIPKRTVDYLGDKFFVNLINKTDKEQGLGQQPIGPESGSNEAIMTQPPMFRSEGART